MRCGCWLQFVVHPVSGRKIPIICDPELVDMSFGTGAVKVRVQLTFRWKAFFELLKTECSPTH